MIDARLFDKLEWLAQKLRNSSKPFGGIQVRVALLQLPSMTSRQVILSGDFFQLPPIAKQDGPASKFAFEADCWPRLFGRANMLALTRVFRQKEDSFVRILEGMRKGRISGEDTAVLNKCDRQVLYDDEIEPVGL